MAHRYSSPLLLSLKLAEDSVETLISVKTKFAINIAYSPNAAIEKAGFVADGG